MSNGYRNGAFALGLVAGIGLALNLFLWLDYLAKDEINSNAEAGQDPQYSEIGGYWDGLIGTFISPSDTLAQWVMAFFTLTATVVLVFTLRAANRTNVAAVQAAEAANRTNQIMRDEQRPWVTIDRDFMCEFGLRGDWGWRLCWNYEFTNKGKSIAHNIQLRCMALKGDHILALSGHSREFTDLCIAKRYNESSTASIFPGETTKMIRFGSKIYSAFTEARDDDGVFRKHPAPGKHVVLLACVTYPLSLRADADIGAETRAFLVKERQGFLGPWNFQLQEISTDRVLR